MTIATVVRDDSEAAKKHSQQSPPATAGFFCALCAEEASNSPARTPGSTSRRYPKTGDPTPRMAGFSFPDCHSERTDVRSNTSLISSARVVGGIVANLQLDVRLACG